MLAGALLGGGQAALLHPLEHVDEHGRFAHLARADGSDARGQNDRDGNPSDRLGDLLAALGIGAADGPALFASRQSGHYAPPAACPGAPRAAEPPPFLSQGPPFAAA